jgi:hypothetical protein
MQQEGQQQQQQQAQQQQQQPQNLLQQLAIVDGKLNELLLTQDRLPTTYMEPKMFSGLITEDAKTWLQRFSSWIELIGLRDVNRISAAMSSRLDGLALSWFNSLTNDVKQDKTLLFQSFNQQFTNQQPHFLLEQQLADRKMMPGESLDSYIYFIEKQCRTLEKTDREKVIIFIRGLPNDLKTGVLLQRPQNWHETIDAARIAQQTVVITSNPVQYSAFKPQPTTLAMDSTPFMYAQNNIGLYSQQENNCSTSTSQRNISLQPDILASIQETQRDLRSCVTEFTQASKDIIDHLAVLRFDSSRNRIETHNTEDVDNTRNRNYHQRATTNSNNNNFKRSVVSCQFCFKNGHTANTCYQLKRELNKPVVMQNKCEICGRNNHTTERCYYKNRTQRFNDQHQDKPLN